MKTIYIIGDSTSGVKYNPLITGEKIGWAELFHKYTKNSLCKVSNSCMPGHSLRDFFHRGILNKIIDNAVPGDILMACHGSLEKAPLVREGDRARGSLFGSGEEIQIVWDEYFGRQEIVHTFGWYLKRLIKLSKDKGITLFLLSAPSRNDFREGMHHRSVSPKYARIMREIALTNQVNFMDFNELTSRHLNAIGENVANTLFVNENGDKAHTNLSGADFYAKVAARELKISFSEFNVLIQLD